MNTFCDFITQTRYEVSDIALFRQWESQIEPKRQRPGHWLQYHGQTSDHSFNGAGDQRGRRHYVLKVSGPEAQVILDHVVRCASDTIHCSRIDLQRTCEIEYDLRVIWTIIRAEARNATVIQSETGDTLYINHRTSEFYVRMYEKELDPVWTRLEFECKRQLAENVLGRLQAGFTLDSVYSALLERSKLPQAIVDHYETASAPVELNGKGLKDRERKLEWIANTLSHIGRVAMEHEYHDYVMPLIANLYKSLTET